MLANSVRFLYFVYCRCCLFQQPNISFNVDDAVHDTCKNNDTTYDTPTSSVCGINQDNSSLPIYVSRTLYHGPSLLATLMAHLGWRYVIVIYENATGLLLSLVRLCLMNILNILVKLVWNKIDFF